jgi:hypothetical protein
MWFSASSAYFNVKDFKKMFFVMGYGSLNRIAAFLEQPFPLPHCSGWVTRLSLQWPKLHSSLFRLRSEMFVHVILPAVV